MWPYQFLSSMYPHMFIVYFHARVSKPVPKPIWKPMWCRQFLPILYCWKNIGEIHQDFWHVYIAKEYPLGQKSSHLLIWKSIEAKFLHICSWNGTPSHPPSPQQTWRLKKLRQIVMSIHGKSYRLLGPGKRRLKSFMFTIFFQELPLLHCQEIFCQREGTTVITQYGKRIWRFSVWYLPFNIKKYGDTGIKVHQYWKIMDHITGEKIQIKIYFKNPKTKL